MPRPMDGDGIHRRCSALCVGIESYVHLANRSLRYAIADATAIAERLADPQRGNFSVTVLTRPDETTKAALEEAAKHLLSAPDQRAEDLALLYFSCHGDVNQADHTFCLLPSDASFQKKGMFDPTTLISIYDFARWFSTAKTRNVVVLLDVCHSGGAGVALQNFKLNLDAGPNFFFIGAARQDQVTTQSSKLQHGLFTHCLLRAFEQPPTADGWLTISQILTFISDEIKWFAKNEPTEIQGWSVSVNPNLPLLRNSHYPELCPVPPLWNVPWRRNVFFTGQEDLLSQLTSMLQTEQKTSLTQPRALSGLGGIGKTQLALEYAYRHRQDYHAVLWGTADTREAIISTFVNIAHLLDLPEKGEQDQMVIVEAVKTWLKDRSQWLFVLDNVEDLALVQEFLPPAFRGHLLLTTRAQAMGKVVGSKLEVKEMPPEMGARFLLRRARMLTAEASIDAKYEEEVTRAKALAEELGGLPLAIDQAGAYIEETQCGLAGYQRLYQMRHAELLARRGGLRGGQVDDHSESVFTTLSLSFAKVEATNPLAADLLRLCAFLAPDAIPEELLTTETEEQGEVLARVIADVYQLDQAIVSLRAYSFIDRNIQDQVLNVHRLVQAVLRDSMSVEAQLHWMQRAISTVAAAYPASDFANWSTCERLLPHALLCATWIERASDTSPSAIGLLAEAGQYLSYRGQYKEAEPLYQQALSICERDLGTNHPDTGNRLFNLAVLYYEQGRYTEAEPLYRRALSIREQDLGTNHPDTATCLDSLALLYWAQGRYIEAEQLYQRALSIYEQGEASPLDVAANLNNMASLYQDQGKYEEATPLYQRAFSIYEQELGANHPNTVICLGNLAVLYQYQGKYEEAEPLYQRTLSIREQELGADHPDTALSLNNLASLYRDQGKYEEAEPLYQRALSIREQKLGANHPNTAQSLNNLASLYRAQGKHEEAEPLYRRALSIREQELGADHPNTAESLNGLAGLYRDQGKYEEAEPLYQRALSIREQELGADHPDTAQSLNNLASLYRTQGKHAEAEPLYRRALTICEQELGIIHPNTMICLDNLAALYRTQGKYAEAEPLYRRALAIREQQLGSEHPDTVETRTRLITLLRTAGKYEEAAQLEAVQSEQGIGGEEQ